MMRRCRIATISQTSVVIMPAAIDATPARRRRAGHTSAASSAGVIAAPYIV